MEAPEKHFLSVACANQPSYFRCILASEKDSALVSRCSLCENEGKSVFNYIHFWRAPRPRPIVESA